MGAYLVARLIDRWLTLDGSDEERQAYTWQLESTHRYIAELDQSRTETRHLQGILDGLRPEQGLQPSAVRTALTAFAYFLENEGRLAEALDALALGGRVESETLPPAEFAAIALFAGRLNRLQARWDAANGAYAAAEEAATAAGDRGAMFRSRLGRANVMWGQGNLPQARAAIEQLIVQAAAPELADVRVRAFADLAAVCDRQGLRLEALQANYEAFRLCDDPVMRMRVLGDIGVLLAELGYFNEARQAFELVVDSTATVQVRTNARLELMVLESAVGNRVAFERHRTELRDCASRISPSMAIDYRYKVGIGLARFGQFARAGDSWREAMRLAEEHSLNQWYFRLERMLEHLDGCQPAQAEAGSPEPAVVPEQVAELAAGLREYAAALLS